MKDIKDNRTEFVIARVSKEEKRKVKIDAQDCKSESDYFRHKLGLDK